MFFDESLAAHAGRGVRELRFMRRLPLEELERLLQTHNEPVVVVNSILRH
jgi:hypothetical protein